jgi:hypothetical protein
MGLGEESHRQVVGLRDLLVLRGGPRAAAAQLHGRAPCNIGSYPDVLEVRDVGRDVGTFGKL